MRQHVLRRATTVFLAAVLLGCAVGGLRLDELLPADALLVGEQHDDGAHHQLERDLVQSLAGRGRLAAVALEMAEQGTSTAGLPRAADESTVQASLRWDGKGWPWDAYGPAVMAAVQAGVPVLGANLPRERLAAAMQDASLDATLDGAALESQREAIRAGHCDLLPASQIDPMVRVQLARDRTMARTVADAAQPGRTVLLLAGAGHVDPALGIPRHLPPGLVARPVLLPPSAAAPGTDHCAELRRRWHGRSAG
ncbi:MAG: ChaN family lipoprotein [Ramlibacter sp.]